MRGGRAWGLPWATPGAAVNRGDPMSPAPRTPRLPPGPPVPAEGAGERMPAGARTSSAKRVRLLRAVQLDERLDVVGERPDVLLAVPVSRRCWDRCTRAVAFHDGIAVPPTPAAMVR